MAKKNDIPRDNNIIQVPIEEAMPDNYLPYAVEVAKDRALPDVRDGLKPVHRRIIYGAYMLRAFPDKPYFKSARIVGDILGKYHPHGDTSVYDSMVIMAQNFSTRMPLIDGHGNWGSMDGDNAAAMRYTEARLTPMAMELIRDLEKDTVDMVDNYSASELEPSVLPARYPNLLVNGAFGIAVGLATNIPPHNLREVIDATLACIDNPDITTGELLQYIKGPDLPTGGFIIGKNALMSAYETGEGKVTLRAKAKVEKLENGKFGIVITEFPFRKNKAKLLQQMSEMTDDKRHSKALDMIIDIRDESDRTGIRAVIELKKAADEEAAEKILKYLFKKTELQCNLSFNVVALAGGKPETLGLKAILKHYINHQKDIITRRTKRELDTAEKRFHIIEGFIKAIDIIDEIIKTIRASKSKKDSENNLVSNYGFTEAQAEAIVELMLYRLTGLEIKVFEKEYKELEKTIKYLKTILEKETELFKVIKKELAEVRDKHGDDRRTQIIEDDNEAKIDYEELIVVEDSMVTMSNEGFIKRIPIKSFIRTNFNIEDIEYREGDYNKFFFQSNSLDTVLFFSDKGNMYGIKGVNIPEFKWKEKGERIDSLIRGFDSSNEKIVGVFSVSNFAEGKEFVLFSSKGCIKKTPLDRFSTNYSKIMALKLRENEKLIDIRLAEGIKNDLYINIRTMNGLEFCVKKPEMESAERNTSGIQLFDLNKTDEVAEVNYTNQYESKVFAVETGRKGLLKISRVPNKAAGNKVVTDSDSKLLLFISDGRVLKIPSFVVENIADEIEISKISDSFDENKNSIIKIISVKEFSENAALIFLTKYGLVKKTFLSEFSGEYSVTVGYKLKSENDILINVEAAEDNAKSDVLLITKKAMAIRFNISSINPMGKNASGVTGISLSEDDEVIFGEIVNCEDTENSKDKSEIYLVSRKSGKKAVKLKDIKAQNRAGRGKNLMLVVLDDYIKGIETKK